MYVCRGERDSEQEAGSNRSRGVERGGGTMKREVRHFRHHTDTLCNTRLHPKLRAATEKDGDGECL